MGMVIRYLKFFWQQKIYLSCKVVGDSSSEKSIMHKRTPPGPIGLRVLYVVKWHEVMKNYQLNAGLIQNLQCVWRRAGSIPGKIMGES